MTTTELFYDVQCCSLLADNLNWFVYENVTWLFPTEPNKTKQNKTKQNKKPTTDDNLLQNIHYSFDGIYIYIYIYIYIFFKMLPQVSTTDPEPSAKPCKITVE